MKRGQRPSAEQVVLMLRQIEVQTAQGKNLALICTDLPPMKWSALRYGFRASGADPVCGPRPMQVLGL